MIERQESTGRDTVFMSKGGPALINITTSELNKTNPASFQAVSHQNNQNNRMRFQN